VRALAHTTALTAVVLSPLTAQQPAPRALTRPEAQFEQSFDAVLTVRELPSGKLLVTDLGPKTVILADFGSGTQATIGRNGQGPGEYQFPGELLPYRNDTTLLIDRVSRRFLTIAADGTLGPTIPFPDAIQGLGEPRGTDRQGRIYFQGSPFPGGPGEGTAREIPDTVPVLRWDRTTGRVDTVARVKIAALKMQVSGGPNARMVMMRPQPYAPADEWAVAPDGRIAVVRVGDYHVEWLGNAAVRGPPVGFERIRVGPVDRQAYLDNMRTSRNRITITRGGGGRGPDLKPPELNEADFEWPDYKPPFPARAGLMSPEGQLWLARSTPAGDSTPTYDIFDGQGNLTGRVTLPIGRRAAGLGRGTLYAVRTDEDGLQWLERYRR
jgi:hypothetical protein